MLAHCSSVATVAAGFDEEVTEVSLTFDPYREMDRLTSQLLGTSAPTRSPRWMPMDLYRVDDHYVVTIDLPGVDPGSIDLNVDGNTLTISAERSLRSDEGVQWLAQERPVGSYLRQLQLGDGLDVEKIQASYDSGVLTVTIPVAERARPRRITVDSGGGRTAVDANRTVQGEVTSSN